MRENLSTASIEAEQIWSSYTFHDQSFSPLFTLAKVISVLTAFYSVGRLIGNPHSKRETILLIAVLWFYNNPACQAVLQVIPISSYFYATAVIFIQAGISTISSRAPKPPRHGENSDEHTFLRPMIFPCQTTHTRLFPTKHSFSYSYLLVGVPVEWNGSAGALLSAGEGLTKPAWFSVRADDYLSRSRSKTHIRLQTKLEAYLSSQGVPPERYRYAYLVTAPRILGFSFNPVSFWYLYDHEQTLCAMILEVNNTFDERRMYLMQRTADEISMSRETFSDSWSKDFHVSPFNDREGSYSLTAKDFMQASCSMRLDNNIVLRDNESRAKIVARVFSTEPGIDPYITSTAQAWTFLLRWWWVGFMTNPRILREARMLWVKKLQVYYRPEVLKSSIGRNETFEETTLEPYFRAYLARLADALDKPVVILYSPAAGPDRGSVVKLGVGNTAGTGDAYSSMDVSVMTPAFYSEIVRCRSMEQAFTRFCFTPADGEAMVSVSDSELLRRLLQKSVSGHNGLVPATLPLFLYVRLMTYLRSGTTRLFFTDIWDRLRGKTAFSTPTSDLDDFVSLSHPYAAYKAYLRCVIRLLVADRIALSFVWLLSSYRLLVCLLCFAQVGRVTECLCLHSLSLGNLHSLVFCAVLVHGSGHFFAVN